MLSDFRLRFPAVPGDVAAVERCCDELTDRAQKIRDTAGGISSAIGRTNGWEGKAREACETSYEKEKNELTIWDSGTDEAAASLLRYAKVLEAELRIISEVRAQAEDLWAMYCSLSAEERKHEARFYAAEVAFLSFRYDRALDGIDEQAAVTAAELRAALYFTPEDIQKNADGSTTDVGDTTALTSDQIAHILEQLGDLSHSLIEPDQGSLGDCHLLASLNAYDQTPEGRAYLASLISPHQAANGTVDGFLVRFPGLNGGTPFLVKEILTHGDKRLGGGIDAASIFEMAYIKAHPGGTKSGLLSGGASGSLSAITMREISGSGSSVNLDFFRGKENAQQAAIDAIRDGKPVVAEAMPDLMTPDNNITVTVDGQPTKITLPDMHVYTVIGADADGVTLSNPWGKNNSPGAPSVGPAFTMTWKDFHAQFTDITVGATPWTK